jgi:tRNA (guanine37-N1)-methyltransferase
MNFHVVTLFPEVIEQYANTSILGRAQKNKIVKVKVHQLRQFAGNKWGKVDERAYGGGPGMVLRAEPIVKAVEKIKTQIAKAKSKRNSLHRSSVLQKTGIKKRAIKILITSAGGKPLTNSYARNLAMEYSDVIIVCGRYEGVDSRAKKILSTVSKNERFRKSFMSVEEVSIGNYILTGGEIPALAIIDATARHIPGVLGKIESLEESRVASHDIYTRPEIMIYHNRKYRVPKVLLSGHHAKIDEHRSKKRSSPR